MEGNYRTYNFASSRSRIDEILNAPSGRFDERDSLPARDALTYDNGFYANCTALFVDIRDSSGLTQSYTRPILAKIYRSFISEVTAILNSDLYVREVNIVGDCVWATYDTPLQKHIGDVLGIAGSVSSLISVLNYKMARKGYDTPIKVGIGISYGRALMVKAGYKGSGINDVIYMGDVINTAAHLAGMANKSWQYKELVIDGSIFSNLPDEYQSWFTSIGWPDTKYTGSVVNTAMNDWYNDNCQ